MMATIIAVVATIVSFLKLAFMGNPPLEADAQFSNLRQVAKHTIGTDPTVR
jgi:hypothetical protein